MTTPPRRRASWLVPTGLVLLSLVPSLAGAMRVTELASDPVVTEANARFVSDPLPVVVHIVTVTVYSLLGAFQFSAGLRRRHPGWHRRAGRVLVVAGLGSAVSGIWMTMSYDLPPTDDGIVLDAMRILVGVVMIVGLVLAVRAIRRGDVPTHRAWMMRAYALGLGAGTQVFTHIPYEVLVGTPGEVGRTLLMGAGWLINIVVVEVILRRTPAPRRPTPRVVLTPQAPAAGARPVS